MLVGFFVGPSTCQPPQKKKTVVAICISPSHLRRVKIDYYLTTQHLELRPNLCVVCVELPVSLPIPPKIPNLICVLVDGRQSKRSAWRIVHMRRQMLGQIVGARETLAARLAMVRPLAGMNAQVARQIRFAAERTAAEQAHERPFAGVLAHVQLQVLLGADAFAAERARETAAGRGGKIGVGS